MSAIISDCGTYRYRLERCVRMGSKQRTIVFCMLNPSTADATQDDRTIRRCINFAKSWGYTDLVVVNLFAFRSAYPAELWTHADPVGPDNDFYILQAARNAESLVCAWGADGGERANAVLTMIREKVPDCQLVCLKHNKDGSPVHPLYQPGNAVLIPWVAP